MSYEEKLENFRETFERHHNERMARLYPTLTPDMIECETGYKFDKVFVNNGTQRLGHYMVESRTGAIYGITSWTQVNKRRQYGTLDTVDQYDWSDFYARPLPGSDAEMAHVKREEEIKAGQKKRGRKRKATQLSN